MTKPASTAEQSHHKEIAIPDTLYGEMIVLRKARLDDGENLYNNIWSDRAITKNMFFPPSVCRDEIPDRIARTVKLHGERIAYVIALKDTDEAIGLTGIKKESEGVYSEAGICIAAKYHGRGIGKDVLYLLLTLAFDVMGAERFAYYCIAENTASKALAAHYGFVYDSTIKEVRQHDEKEFAVERYVLDRKMR